MQTLKVFEGNLVALQNNMLSYALTLTANKETAEDLRQETNLRTLDNRNKFKNNQNFRGWVFTIMHNIFVNDYRKAVRQKTMLARDLYSLSLYQYSRTETPESVYSCVEITRIINSFKSEDRTPLWMHIFGYKYKEIAQIMKLPLGTVKSRIFFIRKKIRKNISD